MENEFFSPFTKIKNKKKRQKLNEMSPTLVYVRANAYNPAQEKN